jgi:uncharacterized OsmC-like protein
MQLPAGGVTQVDAEQIRAYINKVGAAPHLMDRQPRVVAQLVGDSRSKVTFGDAALYLGGDGELNPMQALLGTLAACDVDLVAMHAALLGIEIIELWVEASGHFHVARYLGLESNQPPGYQDITYTVHLRVREATQDQIELLRQRCETGSPVGDTLARSIPLALELDVSAGAATTSLDG